MVGIGVVRGRAGVRGDLVVASSRGPMVNASRTRQRTRASSASSGGRSITALVDPRRRWLIPNGRAGSSQPDRSSREPRRWARRSADAQPVDRPIRRDQGTGVAVRQKSEICRWRERRGSGGALSLPVLGRVGVHDSSQGWCQPPLCAVRSSAAAGPHDPGRTGGPVAASPAAVA